MNFLDYLKKINTKRFVPLSFIRNLSVVLSHNAAAKNNPLIVNAINNMNAPLDVSVDVSGILTNYNLVVILSALCNVPGVKYFWTGPSGFIGTERIVFVTEPGTYTVIVSNPFDGRKKAVVAHVKEQESPAKVTTASV